MWITPTQFQQKYNITPQLFYLWKKAGKIEVKEGVGKRVLVKDDDIENRINNTKKYLINLGPTFPVTIVELDKQNLDAIYTVIKEQQLEGSFVIDMEVLELLIGKCKTETFNEKLFDNAFKNIYNMLNSNREVLMKTLTEHFNG